MLSEHCPDIDGKNRGPAKMNGFVTQ